MHGVQPYLKCAQRKSIKELEIPVDSLKVHNRLLGRFAASHPLLLSTEKFTHRRTKGADRICGSFTRLSLFDGRPGHGRKRHDGLGKSFDEAINGADPE
jgi:hypothetical protein